MTIADFCKNKTNMEKGLNNSKLKADVCKSGKNKNKIINFDNSKKITGENYGK